MSADATDLRAHIQDALGEAYTLQRELGGGGMARVFLADETALGRRVVVKVLAPELAEGVSAERFAREVRLAARLQHPNILPVFAAGVAAGAPFYTMPYVEGESLRARLERERALQLADAIGILRDVARALASAHEHGVVHRDVKPDNILLSRDAAVVADFGIAKALDAARASPASSLLTQFGVSVGTPAYMAPEQAAGELDVDQRADLYAWGVVAYELLAGQHPFAGKRTAQAFIVAHSIESPPPLGTARPDLPLSLAAIVMRCLAKAPGDRPATARELIDALGDLTSTTGARVVPGHPVTPSIAVLPFVNLSAESENEYFSDGISEEVLGLLARDPGLRVAARSSSFAFKGKQAGPRAIAEQLQVNTVLEGSVRRVGNRVRITAQLVDVTHGHHLWSDRFDRELTDIFAVQDEIATAIASTLAVRLREAAGTVSPLDATHGAPSQRTRRPVGVEAYDEYLKGLYANRQIGGAGHERAPGHFERALALEPEFAAAHAGLGESFLRFGIFFALPPTDAFARVRRHAQRALAIDPDLADAHWLLAEVALWHDWDVEVSERHIHRALALEAHHAGALITSAMCHNARHRRQEALAAAARAVRVDPLGMGTRFTFLGILFNVREYALVVAEAGRLITEYPQYGEAYRWRALAEIMTGDVASARADLATARELGTSIVWWHANAAVVASQANEMGEVRRERDELLRLTTSQWVPPAALGLVEQALGDYDAALAYYERAFQARDFLMTVLHTDPIFRFTPPGQSGSIDDDPRWIDLVRRVGLSP